MPGPAPVRAVGIAWYARDDWLDRAQELEKRLERDGLVAERAHIDPDTFARWCAARGLDVDAESRTEFANAVVAAKYRNQS